MAYFKKLFLYIFILGLLVDSTVLEETTETEPKELLVESESKDGKLEIIKQIKKVNDDGSYTIGYEADDGSFKIESRDVLGNIKGTYGYLDDSGLLKRVSYSTSNSSELINTKTDASSVVQRILPKYNRTVSSTTRRPSFFSSTQPSSTTRRKLTYVTGTGTAGTTQRTYDIVTASTQPEKSTTRPHVVYSTSATPRVLLQGRSSLRSTPSTHTQTSDQLKKPESSASPTNIPLFKRLALGSSLLEQTLTKPVTEENDEVRSNILRRQLSQDKISNYDAQHHLHALQQSMGGDSSDVYSSSVTGGTARPLFTTTIRSRILSSTTQSPVVVVRPNIKYNNDKYHHRHNLQAEQSSQIAQEVTTTQVPVTSTAAPVGHITTTSGANEPLVAIKHPFQRGTILVPLSQLQQGRLLPVELNEGLQPYYNQQSQQYENQDQYIRESTTRSQEPIPLYVRRLPPPHLRPIPVQVDENGYIRDIPQHAQPENSYPIPVPVTAYPKYLNNEITNEIDHIKPPVSTKDFQKILQLLITRQKKLELARSIAVADPRRLEYFQPRYQVQPVPQPNPSTQSYYVPRTQDVTSNGPIQFVPAAENNRNQYLPQRNQQYRQMYSQDQPVTPTPQSYVPNRRVARLLQNGDPEQQQMNEELLPPDVREMLLLRMLQLAINPALPVEVEDNEVRSTTVDPQYKKVPVRNVEILGEESEDNRQRRGKRYRQDMDYNE